MVARRGAGRASPSRSMPRRPPGQRWRRSAPGAQTARRPRGVVAVAADRAPLGDQRSRGQPTSDQGADRHRARAAARSCAGCATDSCSKSASGCGPTGPTPRTRPSRRKSRCGRWPVATRRCWSRSTTSTRCSSLRSTPGLLAANRVGVEVAGQLLTSAGENAERLTSEAAFAMLCGAASIPASSGKNHPTRSQPRRRPGSQRRRLSSCALPDAMGPTHPRLRRPPHHRRPQQALDHPLPRRTSPAKSSP